MKLQTIIPLEKEENQIGYSSGVLLMGSCFSQNIAKKLDYFGFQNLSNPFGIIFNPCAIYKLIERALNDTNFTEKDIFYLNERWQSYEVHSELSQITKQDFLALLNARLFQLKDSLLNASHVIITLGTAWVYELKETKTIVANCHKVPQHEFAKKLLTASEIEESLRSLQSHLTKLNPKATLIFTVSPVRHIKDGIVENSQSKAHLVTAIHKMDADYFPSYELLMDELRDYRFYEADMLHPNQVAIAYIWERFNSTWISSETLSLQKKVAAIRQGLAHRPFNEASEGHQKFLKDLQQKISEVKKELPNLRF